MEFKVGDKINHEKYGNGIIIGISKQNNYLCEFENENSDLHSGGYAPAMLKCGETGKDNHCYYCRKNNIKLLKKYFTKSDLKDGYKVVFRNGTEAIVLYNTFQGLNKKIYYPFCDLTEDLKETNGFTEWDIIEVHKPKYKKIYHREETVKLTVEEIKEKLGISKLEIVGEYHE